MGLTGPNGHLNGTGMACRRHWELINQKMHLKKKHQNQNYPEDTSCSYSLSIADYIREADKQLAYEGNYKITLPADPTAVAIITKTKLGFFAPAAGDRMTLDQYSGKVLKLDIFKNKPFNERVAGSIKAIHVGNVYGTFTKYFIFLLV